MTEYIKITSTDLHRAKNVVDMALFCSAEQSLFYYDSDIVDTNDTSLLHKIVKVKATGDTGKVVGCYFEKADLVTYTVRIFSIFSDDSEEVYAPEELEVLNWNI